MAPPCIGIDLGAAKTMVVGETGEIVRNELGGHSSASLVGFSGDERYVGEGAVAQLADAPDGRPEAVTLQGVGKPVQIFGIYHLHQLSLEADSPHRAAPACGARFRILRADIGNQLSSWGAVGAAVVQRECLRQQRFEGRRFFIFRGGAPGRPAPAGRRGGFRR